MEKCVKSVCVYVADFGGRAGCGFKVKVTVIKFTVSTISIH